MITARHTHPTPKAGKPTSYGTAIGGSRQLREAYAAVADTATFRAESVRLAVDKRANNAHGGLAGTPNSALVGGTYTIDGSLGFPAVGGGSTAPKSHVRGNSRALRRVVRVHLNVLAS